MKRGGTRQVTSILKHNYRDFTFSCIIHTNQLNPCVSKLHCDSTVPERGLLLKGYAVAIADQQYQIGSNYHVLLSYIHQNKVVNS